MITIGRCHSRTMSRDSVSAMDRGLLRVVLLDWKRIVLARSVGVPRGNSFHADTLIGSMIGFDTSSRLFVMAEPIKARTASRS
jgi:hypothetical protein